MTFFIYICQKSHLDNVITGNYITYMSTCKGNLLFEKKCNGNKMIISNYAPLQISK